jgi:hypothetical protein
VHETEARNQHSSKDADAGVRNKASKFNMLHKTDLQWSVSRRIRPKCKKEKNNPSEYSKPSRVALSNPELLQMPTQDAKSV